MTDLSSPDGERLPDRESSLGGEAFDLESKLNALWGEQVVGNAPAQSGVTLGQRVGPYQVRAFLGAGSFGLVYLADDMETKRPVALKLPRIEVLLDKEKRKRFRVEAEIIGRLKHPHIVRILRSDVAEGSMPYIACDWCTGPDVAAYLDETRTAEGDWPTWAESVRLILKVSDAIHFAHQQGITHRDIKPANLILHLDLESGESGEGLDRFVPRITDFGLARLADPVETTTRTGVVLGTPAYMAPERILAGLAGDSHVATHDEAVRSDIYSLGAVLYEMLTGSPPAKSSSWLELVRRDRPSSLESALQWPSSVPAPVRKVVETCLRHEPSTRYRTAAEFSADLSRLLAGETPEGRPIGVLGRLRLRFGAQDWLKTSGWFAIVSQSIFTAWMMLGDVFKIPFGLLTAEEYVDLLPSLLWIALVSSASVVAVGVYCLKRKWWAPYIGAALACYNLYSPALALLGKPQMFADIYAANNPYLSFLVHLVIAMIFALQLCLFACAIGQSLKQQRR